MAWETVEFRTETGMPLPERERQILLEAASEAILNRDSDPGITIAAVHEAVRQRQFISNLRAYTARTIFRAIRKVEVSEAKRAARTESDYTHKLPGLDFQPEQIENRILIRELMETLTPTDREIFSLRMYRCSFPEIDAQLKLRPRTAEQRYRACKEQLAALLRQKATGLES